MVFEGQVGVAAQYMAVELVGVAALGMVEVVV
jgi:hypothetical protein